MRYLLINPEEIAAQTDVTYKTRTPDGRVVLTEGEAKALDNFSAQFVTAAALRELLAGQPGQPPAGPEPAPEPEPEPGQPEEGTEEDTPEEETPEEDTPESTNPLN